MTSLSSAAASFKITLNKIFLVLILLLIYITSHLKENGEKRYPDPS